VTTFTLIPMKGNLSAMVFENPATGIPRTLFFSVVIPVEFSSAGKMQNTSATLEFIDFGVKSWRELPERECTFPKNPEDGYIDGSLYLHGAHNPADTTRIRFGALREDFVLPTSLDIEFDFTQEGLDDLGAVGRVGRRSGVGSASPRCRLRGGAQNRKEEAQGHQEEIGRVLDKLRDLSRNAQ
jgi:hypothetical protein